jgi:mRNA interferase RelE/StbE
MFELKIDRNVEKSLRKVPSEMVPRLFEAIKALASDPLPPGSRKIAGTERNYRIRVGDYRIIYEIDPKSQLLVIHAAGHRKDVYRDFE